MYECSPFQNLIIFELLDEKAWEIYVKSVITKPEVNQKGCRSIIATFKMTINKVFLFQYATPRIFKGRVSYLRPLYQSDM